MVDEMLNQTMGDLSLLKGWNATLPNTEVMPVLFLGHGSPMNAIQTNDFTSFMLKLDSYQEMLNLTEHLINEQAEQA